MNSRTLRNLSKKIRSLWILKRYSGSLCYPCMYTYIQTVRIFPDGTSIIYPTRL